MSEKEIELKIVDALNLIGIFVSEEDISEISIDEVIQESLTYISFIVELEEAFGVAIPDEYLNPERISSFENIKNMIVELL